MDEMYVRKLHTSPEIIPLSTSMLVNDSFLMSIQSEIYWLFFCAGKVGRIWHETFLSPSIDDMELKKVAYEPGYNPPEFIHVRQWIFSYEPSVSNLLYFFCAGKVGWIWHKTFLSSSIDDIEVSKLHTRLEIIPKSSSKLVNDGSLSLLPKDMQSKVFCTYLPYEH
jgi:hypothetical protein